MVNKQYTPFNIIYAVLPYMDHSTTNSIDFQLNMINN